MKLSEGGVVPDFFIIGAPKSGTTALDAYLSRHPDVFMCRKEAHYFCSDFPGNINFSSFHDYQAIFESAEDGQIIGEASVWYLYSEEAVREILKVNPEAKFIAMLRNPVKAAEATHGELLLDLREDEPDFQKAWRLQEDRRSGKRIPLNCREPKQLLYKDACSWSHQVERLLDVAPKGSVKIIIMEEFFENVDSEYSKVLEFLGLRPFLLDSFLKINESKRVRSVWLLKVSRDWPKRYPIMMFFLKRILNFFGFRPGKKLNDYIVNGNVVNQSRSPLPDGFKDELVSAFSQDIKQLESVLGRRLDGVWEKA